MTTLAEFASKMDSYIKRAAQATRIPYQTIEAQWANESAYGTSALAVGHNNFAGIKYSKSSSTARPITGSDFAHYASINDFVTDYIRVMSLGYYNDVRAAGATGDVVAATQALGASPYDAGHYNDGSGVGSKLLKLLGLTGASSSASLTQTEMTEIARKASLGLPLSNPTAAATAYYEQVSGKKHPAVCPTCHRPL